MKQRSRNLFICFVLVTSKGGFVKCGLRVAGRANNCGPCAGHLRDKFIFAGQILFLRANLIFAGLIFGIIFESFNDILNQKIKDLSNIRFFTGDVNSHMQSSGIINNFLGNVLFFPGIGKTN